MSQPAKKFHVFLSYNGKDEVVFETCGRLAGGTRRWYSILLRFRSVCRPNGFGDWARLELNVAFDNTELNALSAELSEDENMELINLRGEAHATLPELDIFSEFYKIYGELNAVEPDQLELKNRYQERLQMRVDAIRERFSDLTKRMFKFEAVSDSEINPSNQSAAWLDFCKRCVEKFKGLLDLIDDVDPSNFQSVELLQDRELERLFGRYLNAKYPEQMIAAVERQTSA